MCVCQVPVCLSLHPNPPPSSPASAHSEGFRKVKEMLLTRCSLLKSSCFVSRQKEGLCFYLCKARDGGDCRLIGGALLTALCPERLREASLKLCVRATREHVEVTHGVRWSDTHL